jgi:hypothetical protein
MVAVCCGGSCVARWHAWAALPLRSNRDDGSRWSYDDVRAGGYAGRGATLRVSSDLTSYRLCNGASRCYFILVDGSFILIVIFVVFIVFIVFIVFVQPHSNLQRCIDAKHVVIGKPDFICLRGGGVVFIERIVIQLVGSSGYVRPQARGLR